MNRLIPYFLSLAFVFVFTPKGVCSAPQDVDDIANRIIQQGYVDPSQYDSPRHHAAHQEALAWMKTLSTEEISAVAKHLQKPGGKVHRKKDWLELLTGAMGSAPHAVALGSYEVNLNSCAASGVAGVCNIRQFGARGDMRRYNQDIVNLAAAYIRLRETERAQERLGSNVPAVVRPAQAQQPREHQFMADVMDAYYAEPEQIRQQGGEEVLVIFDEATGDWYEYDAELDTFMLLPK